MDAVSPCEQFGLLYSGGGSGSDEAGGDFQDCPWRLLFCKEIFTPWNEEITANPIATNLIYEQIIRGLKSGEYTCDDVRKNTTFHIKIIHFSAPAL